MSRTRRDFVSAGLAAAGVLASGAGAQAPARRRGPPAGGRGRGIVLIVGDDHGRDLGCYGVPVHTPVLDALAAEGVRFDQAYASVSSCSSSRATLYTGLYSHTNGMYGLSHDIHNFSLLENVRTVPWMLRQAGYATALVGKLHVRPEAAMGLDAWLLPERAGDRDVAAMGRAAGRWIRERDGAPFLLVMGYSDPHRSGDATGFGNDRAWPGIERRRYRADEVAVPRHLPDLPGVRADLAQYYEAVSRMDAGIGVLLRELEAAGRSDDTLVIYLSDNGRPFPAAKDNLYTDGIHLPLIVRAPGSGAAGVRNEAMVSWIDIAPTLLDWAGVAVPGDYAHAPLPGRSILPILAQARPQGWDEVFATHSFHEIQQYYPVRAVRDRRCSHYLNLAPELEVHVASDVALSPAWKAIESTPGARLGRRPVDAFLHRPAEELYDLSADPDETVNLAADPAHAPALAALRARLQDWRTRSRDPWLAATGDPYGHMRK